MSLGKASNTLQQNRPKYNSKNFAFDDLSAFARDRRSSSSSNNNKNQMTINNECAVGGDSNNAFFKPHLYLLQQMAPKAVSVPTQCPPAAAERHQSYAQNYYHGSITRQYADSLLEAAGDGAFLVRRSSRDPTGEAFTLCLRFDGQTKNYKLYYDGCRHFVGEKKFDTVEDLVTDGLITMYLEKYADDYINRMNEEVIYDQTPYSQYKRTFSRITAPDCSPILTKPATPLFTPNITLKAHRFKSHTFKGPHWCDYCGNFMWGLVQQGLKCEDCGFGAHKKCEEKVPQDCKPDMKYVRRIFGVDLTTLTMAHRNPVPDVVRTCINEIETRGLDSEGLYRVSGSHDEIEKLRAQLDAEGKADLSQDRVEDINSVAGLLKLFLRSLPQPLITDNVYDDLMDAVRRRYDEDKICCAQRALRQLPEAHRATLVALLSHLSRVARNAQQNKMDAENLSRVFTPTLLRRPLTAPPAQACRASVHGSASPFNRSPDSSLAIHAQHQEQLILQFLINFWPKIFSEGNR